MLSEGKTLTMDQITMLLWETVIETADTTMVTTEWAMYEIAKNPKQQVYISSLIYGFEISTNIFLFVKFVADMIACLYVFVSIRIVSIKRSKRYVDRRW